MIKPRCFTHIEWQYEGDGYQTHQLWSNGMAWLHDPVVTTLTLRGYFSVEHRDECLIFKGEQGLGTSCLIDCTEDEMIMIQNLLQTIRS